MFTALRKFFKAREETKKNMKLTKLLRSASVKDEAASLGRSVVIYTKSGQEPLQSLYMDGTSCEDVCVQIGQQLGITPVVLFCFSLARMEDDGRIQWLSWTDFVNFSLHSEPLHFRMRILPHSEKLSELQQVDENCLKYLYFQLKSDFQAGRLEYYKNGDKQTETLGVVAVAIFVEMRMETEFRDDGKSDVDSESVISFMKTKDYSLKKFLPSNLKKNFVERWTIDKSITDKLTDYQKRFPYPDFKFRSLIHIQVNVILKSSYSFYYCERYNAFDLIVDENNHIVSQSSVEIVIEMGCENPIIKLVQQAQDELHPTVKEILLSDVVELLVTTVTTDGVGWWKISMIRRTGIPLVLYFKTGEETISCVSCLEVYHRLYENFYDSLCREVKPRLCQLLTNLRAHGPATDEFLQKKLQDKQNSFLFILRSSPNQYSVFEILRWDTEKTALQKASLGKLVYEEGRYMIEGLDLSPEEDPWLLLQKVIRDKEVLHVNCVRLKPQTEGCNLIQNLLHKKSPERICDVDEEDRIQQKKLDIKPKVYLPSEINLQAAIGSGCFTTVVVGMLNNTDQIVVKQLTDLDFTDVRIYKELEKTFHEVINQHIYQSDRAQFVHITGIQLTSPPGVIMPRAIYGSLRLLLQDKNQSNITLTLKHLVSVVLQLGSMLMYMSDNKFVHGNLHCDNLLVFKYESSSLGVRLADPGMVSLYNKLPLKSNVNQKRLPWLAPERHTQLDKVSIETEMYACGTTMWQMFSGGSSPLDVDPALKHKTFSEQVSYLANNNGIRSMPEYLKKLPSDPENIIKMKEKMFNCLMSCWAHSPQDRPDPKAFVRTVHSKVVYYGEGYYHNYQVVSDEDSAYPLSGHSSSTSVVSMVTGIHVTSQAALQDLMSMLSIGDNKDQTMVKGIHTAPKIPLINPAVSQLAPSLRPLASIAKPRKGPILSNVNLIITADRLKINEKDKLGMGHYGAIYKGSLTVNKEQIIVAVKVVKPEMVELFAEAFYKEALLMEKLEHPNIVKFYGVCNDGEQIVMEFVENNSLHKNLERWNKAGQEKASMQMLLKICLDIAKGLEYLESQKVLHCDLAARNILLTKQMSAKISDFGLSKVMQADKNYYRRSKNTNSELPIFWAAPELIVLEHFTSKCDIWSYGVVLWEIETGGMLPNLLLVRRNVTELHTILEKGERLPKPAGCSDDMYRLMQACWQFKPENRPTCTDIKKRVQKMLEMCSQDKTVSAAQPVQKDNPVTSLPLSKKTGKTTGDVADLHSLEITMKVRLTQEMPARTMISQPLSPDMKGAALLTEESSPVLENGVGQQHTDVKLVKNTSWMIPDSMLQLHKDRKLGKGAFGYVFEGTYNGSKVAVKECTDETKYDRFTREFEVIARMKHPNIIKFIGLYKKEHESCFYIMEFMLHGNLSSYLQKCSKNNHPVPYDKKVQFLEDIAKGMHYLEEQKIIHGDLTADNVLVNEKLEAKIADFGFAKILSEKTDIYMRGPSSFFKRWWASPEVFTGSLNIHSDIWSFGIVGIEVFLDCSLSQKYGKFEDNNREEILEKIESGEQFVKPLTCPDELYAVFLSCWKRESSQRISFKEILNSLSAILNSLKRGEGDGSWN